MAWVFSQVPPGSYCFQRGFQDFRWRVICFVIENDGQSGRVMNPVSSLFFVRFTYSFSPQIFTFLVAHNQVNAHQIGLSSVLQRNFISKRGSNYICTLKLGNSLWQDRSHREQASLVVKCLRICLSMQGTWVQTLVWEDSTCLGATKPVCPSYWAHAP